MSFWAVARNDLRGASRERGIWALFAGFVVGFAGVALLLVEVDAPEFGTYLDLLAPGVGLLVPLAGIALGYEVVVGERESGAAALSLSLPNSRADLLAGKLVGRATTLAAATTAAALVAGVVLVAAFPAFDPVRYLGFTVATVAYGVVFLCIAAGLSTALSTARRVIAAAFGAYVGLALSWGPMVDVLVVVLFRFRPTALVDPPTWATFATFVGPRTAFGYLLGYALDAGSVPPVAVDASADFVSPTVAVLALVGWAVLSLVAGYVAFRRSDL